MIEAKFCNKVPKYIVKQVPDVVGNCSSLQMSENNMRWVVFYDGEIPVGVTCFTYESHTFCKELPSWKLYIDLFEVCEKQREKGYARQMVKWIESIPTIGTIELCTCSPTVDGGRSYNFWKHMGYSKVPNTLRFLRKKIKK
jgi:hypothetical protein